MENSTRPFWTTSVHVEVLRKVREKGRYNVMQLPTEEMRQAAPELMREGYLQATDRLQVMAELTPQGRLWLEGYDLWSQGSLLLSLDSVAKPSVLESLSLDLTLSNGVLCVMVHVIVAEDDVYDEEVSFYAKAVRRRAAEYTGLKSLVFVEAV